MADDDFRDEGGDTVVCRCSLIALACSAAAAVTGVYACENTLLRFFAPELAWLLLVPATLLSLIALVGVCVSRREVPDFFRAQIAVFLMVLAVVLAGAGCFAFFSSQAVAHWMLGGCESRRTRGSWEDAGRLAPKMERLEADYEQLRSAWRACRELNPLVFDLADCGIRARLPGGKQARNVSLYGWYERTQMQLGCGGFCEEEVPVFGLATLPDTLVTKKACAREAAAWMESAGFLICIFTAVLAVLVLVVSLVLLGSTVTRDNGYDEIDSSDPDDDNG